MSVGNVYHNADMETVLQCPICLELPPNMIFLCKVGHHMCDRCRKRLSSCPTCKSPLTGSRNFVAEEIVSRISIFKESDSATENNNIVVSRAETTAPVDILQENVNHLTALSVPPGTYSCLLESCKNKAEMGIGGLVAHVAKVHAHLFQKFQNSNCTFAGSFENFCLLSGKRKFHQAFHVSNMGLFFLNILVLEDRYFNCWLTTPAPVKRSNKFNYEIEFIKECNEERFYFTSKMASNLQTSNWLLQRGRVFILPPKKHGLQDNDFFSIHVKIVYRAPEESNEDENQL